MKGASDANPFFGGTSDPYTPTQDAAGAAAITTDVTTISSNALTDLGNAADYMWNTDFLSEGVKTALTGLKDTVSSVVSGVSSGIGIPSWLLYILVIVAVLVALVVYMKLI